MGNRARGVVLLAVALLAVAIGTGLHLRVVPGAAAVVPPPGPPAAGDCLVDTPPGTTWGYQFDGNDPLITYRPDYPAADFGPCAGSRFGEVVDVLASPAPVTLRRSDQGIQVSDPTAEACLRARNAYLGAPTTPAYFVPSSTASADLLGPGDRQRAAGQHWAACVVTATGHNGGPVALPVSARGLWSTGADRDLLGACQVLVQWANAPDDGACGLRHRSEIFATVALTRTAAVTRAGLESDCRAYVGRVTGLADPTGGGKLLVSLRIFADGSSLDIGRSPAADSLIVCGVETVGAVTLTGSLIAWGDRPLPLA